MPASAEPPFPPRGERGYDAAAVETFPWPVMAGYDDVHRWMDQGHAVHTAWQLRDVWEGLLKFLATLTAADHLAAVPTDDPRTKKALPGGGPSQHQPPVGAGVRAEGRSACR
jgi:hypothetical protein